jgi:hypothetical protein
MSENYQHWARPHITTTSGAWSRHGALILPISRVKPFSDCSAPLVRSTWQVKRKSPVSFYKNPQISYFPVTHVSSSIPHIRATTPGAEVVAVSVRPAEPGGELRAANLARLRPDKKLLCLWRRLSTGAVAEERFGGGGDHCRARRDGRR